MDGDKNQPHPFFVIYVGTDNPKDALEAAFEDVCVAIRRLHRITNLANGPLAEFEFTHVLKLQLEAMRWQGTVVRAMISDELGKLKNQGIESTKSETDEIKNDMEPKQDSTEGAPSPEKEAVRELLETTQKQPPFTGVDISRYKRKPTAETPVIDRKPTRQHKTRQVKLKGKKK